MSEIINQQLIDDVIAIAKDAGKGIMTVYARDFSIYEKDDKSPLTEADLLAHNIIVDGLATLPTQFPILSEENADISWEERKSWTTYWLVDPLDGTKEFIKQNGEFTVNIALVHQGVPIMGVVYAPAIETLYWGAQGFGAFKKLDASEAVSIQAKSAEAGETVKVVGSRSHPSPDMASYLEQFESHEMIAMGSSLKLCLVAEGVAHVYPRLGPTSEWDTGAAHGVVLQSGARVVTIDGAALQYNQKDSVLNPYFIVEPV
ncbi:3'(2'),5'-bisphosphate nucleotidase CysQ [Echinimonas agarilytica]|uniref:3'(2'),5'-bisphosphate nucleotidase CysQ n=1 Tax=Echinimonas agarilytica TaxID=1215918 RepID=A0AA42B6R9_9GAMM|nr:3'(2'),5'-bisphosphate nucleotidase CysQ [Echinimonas agarilytica]MCM2679074.1 3'(2'),5'-bisphosphate nucleotidase CysQ [Echinimonas agarilytica]